MPSRMRASSSSLFSRKTRPDLEVSDVGLVGHGDAQQVGLQGGGEIGAIGGEGPVWSHTVSRRSSNGKPGMNCCGKKRGVTQKEATKADLLALELALKTEICSVSPTTAPAGRLAPWHWPPGRGR